MRNTPLADNTAEDRPSTDSEEDGNGQGATEVSVDDLVELLAYLEEAAASRAASANAAEELQQTSSFKVCLHQCLTYCDCRPVYKWQLVAKSRAPKGKHMTV